MTALDRAMATPVATRPRGNYGCRVDRHETVSAIARELAALDESNGQTARPLTRIRTVVQIRAKLDALLTDYVTEARKPLPPSGWWSQGRNAGTSWGEIARALGVSKQAAIKRYAQATVDRWGEDARGYGGASTGTCPVKEWPAVSGSARRECGKPSAPGSPYCAAHTTRPVSV